MISPCPFSSGYRIPNDLAWASLRIFFIYRVVLAGLFTTLYFGDLGPSLLGKHDAGLYTFTSSAYLAAVLFAGISLFLRKPDYSFQAQTQIFIDLLALTLLMHACGGITSGLGILLAVSVAAGGLLLGGVCATLFAALASLAVLAETVYSDLTHAFPNTTYTYAGMLGASFFTIALLSYVLARRAEQMDALATERAFAIAQLQELNEYIIQHLQSGIVIVGENERVRMLNASALRLFQRSGAASDLAHLSPELAKLYRQWRSAPEREAAVLSPATEREIYVRFTSLSTAYGNFHMLFLEDTALRNQRVQQSKLASLGRLTASIAHEIRNPLSAINHAAELLAENPSIAADDRRLTEIIRDNSRRMNNMIEDILRLSRRGPSRRREIALSAWLTDYRQRFLEEHGKPEHAIRLEVADENIRTCIDTDHLKQILDNLCLNAFKHAAGETGRIRLRCGRGDRRPCIEVIDQGPGIDPGQAKHLFEPFFTTSPSGTGLGLFISRELAQLNQATLDYYSPAKGGSCFRLTLPDAENTVIQI